MCDWREFEEDDPRVRRFVACERLVPPFAFLSTDASNAEQHVCAKRWAQTISKPKGRRFPGRKPVSGRPLRVGYLSGDFHDHATSRLVAELFESHNRTRVTVYGYSYGPDEGGPLRERIIRSFQQFRDLKDASSEAISRLIYQDGIDVLVDMKGYTNMAQNRNTGVASCTYSGQLSWVSRNYGSGLHRLRGHRSECIATKFPRAFDGALCISAALFSA